MRRKEEGRKAGNEGAAGEIGEAPSYEHENLDHAILVAVPPLTPLVPRLGAKDARNSLAASLSMTMRRTCGGCSTRSRAGAAQVRRDDGRAFDVAHEKLRLKHKEQQARQHEHIGTIKWSSKRRAEKHASIQRQKCANLDLDMRQANAFDACKSPELVVHPSARHQRRRGFDATASQLNGRKLLDSIRGKKTDEHVYVAPVCQTHVFEKPLLDTHVYDMNSSHYMASE